MLTAAEDLLAAVPRPPAGTRVRLIDSQAWRTPVSDLPACSLRNVRITHEIYKPGYYRLEGVGGYEAYRLLAPLKVTVLQGRPPLNSQVIVPDPLNPPYGRWAPLWRTWMVDDPYHCLAMRALVDQLPAGHILCAGLGLGLMVHQLARKTGIKSITVVESERDVIELIRPTLPPDPIIDVVHAEWENYLASGCEADGILWDLAVGEQEETVPSLLHAARTAERYLPDAGLIRFGLRDQRQLRPSHDQ